MQKLFYPLLFLVFYLSSCHSHEKVIIDNANISADSKNDSVSNGTVLFKLKNYSLIDSSISKDQFLTCMMPANWDFSYYTRCVTGDNEFPMKYGMVAQDTDGIKRFELFPVYSFITTSTSDLSPKDSIQSDKMNVMKAQNVSATAVDAIKEFILPYCRKELGNDYHITEIKTLNNLPQENAADNSEQNETGLVILEYNMGGKAFEEIVFATLGKKYISINGYDSKCTWHINYACSFRTLKGQLKDELGTLQTIIGSMRYNSNWYFKYNYVVQSLQKLDQKYNVETITNLYDNSPFAKTSNDLAVFENQEKRMAKAFDIYTIYNISVDAYINSNGDVIRLPKGFSMAWENSKDDYLLADKTDYNPGGQNEVKWIALKKNESLIAEEYLIGCNDN